MRATREIHINKECAMPFRFSTLGLAALAGTLLSGPGAGVAAPAESLFPIALVPSVASANDTSSVELGMTFSSAVAGTVTGVRFYKGPSNTGTHVGHLWDHSGHLLASVTFTGETATGWQQALFSKPIAITANTSYIVSYFAPKG